MAVYYIDGTNLSNSTAVYDDEELTVCSADGYYSNGGIVRQLVNCVLQSQQTCTGSLSCPIEYTVCYSDISAAELCCRNREEKIIYISSDYTFDNAPHFYEDTELTIISPTGWYSDDIVGACASPSIPCGTGINASFSGNGSFSANINLANDTGAVLLYFFMGNTIPDGVLATYNSNTFNRLTCEGNHNTYSIEDGSSTAVDYAGINNQGTGLITYVGNSNSSLLNDSPYNATPTGTCVSGDQPENYTYDGTSYVAQSTYSTVTVASDQIGVNPGTGNSRVFTMVIPKISSTPTQINLLISAPMCSTFFRWEVQCPLALPNFQASLKSNSTTCAADAMTYYFARNATGTNSTFVIDTNTIPEIGNWVFADANGSSYLNDTNIIQYYIIANTTAIGVRNGVVVSSAACT